MRFARSAHSCPRCFKKFRELLVLHSVNDSPDRSVPSMRPPAFSRSSVPDRKVLRSSVPARPCAVCQGRSIALVQWWDPTRPEGSPTTRQRRYSSSLPRLVMKGSRSSRSRLTYSGRQVGRVTMCHPPSFQGSTISPPNGPTTQPAVYSPCQCRLKHVSGRRARICF